MVLRLPLLRPCRRCLSWPTLASVTTAHATDIISVDQTALANAQLMRDACLQAAANGGTRVQYDAGELGDDELGLFTGDPTPAGRRIVIRPGMDLISEALVLAHEVGHRCDPSLNTYAMMHYYERNTDVCEAVAHYTSFLVADAYYLLPCIRYGWFADIVNSHYPVDAFLQDDQLVHRADVGAFKIVYPDAANELRALRAAEGRPLSGMTLGQRIWRKARESRGR